MASATALRGRGVTALLSLQEANAALVDAWFVPLDVDLAEGAAVAIQCSDGRSFPIGKVHLVEARVNIGAVRLPGMGFIWGTGLVFYGTPSLTLQQLGPVGTRCDVLVDGKPVMHGLMEAQHLALVPILEPLYSLRVGAGQRLDVDAVGASGGFDLVLQHPAMGAITVPIATWQKVTRPVPVPEPPLPQRLSIAHRTASAE